jgi:23S rRNA (guanine745-N1)-methyltransferase
MIANHYLCPLCQQPLKLKQKSFCCDNNHSFDCAKEGYVNLLPVQFKHSKDPGDNKAMVNARRAFLEKGFYQPLVEKMQSLYRQLSVPQALILDSGCGEGYYTAQHKTPSNEVYGVDIAKNAIKIAAKRHQDCHFSVGSVAHFPFDNNIFDWIYSVYAPLKASEFIRLLKPQGYLLTVTPASQHLFELKEMIYRQAKAHPMEKDPLPELKLVNETRLSYPMEFSDNEDILNLLAMTPFAFKTTETLLERIKNLSTFRCQADFLLRIYQKNEG